MPGEFVEHDFAALASELAWRAGERGDAFAVCELDAPDCDWFACVVESCFVEGFGGGVEHFGPLLAVHNVLAGGGLVGGAEPYVPPAGNGVAHVLVALDVRHTTTAGFLPDFEGAVVEQPCNLIGQKVFVQARCAHRLSPRISSSILRIVSSVRPCFFGEASSSGFSAASS